jgi:ribosomal protein S21
MSVEVHRRRGESFDGFIRRFGRKVQMSGRLIQARKIRFHKPETSKPIQREAALKRERRRSYYIYLEKLGKLDEELDRLRSRKRRRR